MSTSDLAVQRKGSSTTFWKKDICNILSHTRTGNLKRKTEQGASATCIVGVLVVWLDVVAA
jgi:hypothetical protein